MLIQTSWESVQRCALVMSLVASLAGCSDSKTGSKYSPIVRADAGDLPDGDSPKSSDVADASSGDAASTGEASTEDGGRPEPPPTAAGNGDRGAEHVHTGPWRIVPLGDSITEGSCTSQLLWQRLREAGAKDIDMIGTKHSDKDCGVADADRDNEGHSGYLATDLVDNGRHASELTEWCNADKGDVVLMHLGTNDIWHKQLKPELILNAFSEILAALRAVQPKVIVFVAQIIPMKASDCSECAADVPLLNQQIPAWAERESSEDSPVYVVDQFTGFDPATDSEDGVHPNKQGAQKMADKWSAMLLKRVKLQ